MSIDDTAWLHVGYLFDHEDIEKAFTVHLDKKARMEARWDPNTGKKLEDAEVVDQIECDVLMFEGEAYSHMWDLLEAVTDYLGASFSVGGWCDGPDFVVIGAGDYYDSRDCYDPKKLAEAAKESKKLAKKLKKLGLTDLSQFGVWIGTCTT